MSIIADADPDGDDEEDHDDHDHDRGHDEEMHWDDARHHLSASQTEDLSCVRGLTLSLSPVS